MEVSFDEFISGYPDETVENAYLTRELILGMFGQLKEEIDVEAKLIGYSFGRGYKNTLYTLIPSNKSLKLGFNRGTWINDPEGMLAGNGKVHKFVIISNFFNQKTYLRYLLNEGFKVWMQMS